MADHLVSSHSHRVEAVHLPQVAWHLQVVVVQMVWDLRLGAAVWKDAMQNPQPGAAWRAAASWAQVSLRAPHQTLTEEACWGVATWMLVLQHVLRLLHLVAVGVCWEVAASPRWACLHEQAVADQTAAAGAMHLHKIAT